MSNMWYAYDYTTKPNPRHTLNGVPQGSRRTVALEVYGTLVEGTDIWYAVWPIALPDDIDDSYRASWDKYGPKVVRVDYGVFGAEHQVYAYLMRQSEHKLGEKEGALRMYERDREMWRAKWMAALGTTMDDVRKLERGF